MLLKLMGVINITPNSFSDGAELDTTQKIIDKIHSFGKVHALDIGAESTAPKNEPLSWSEEWARWKLILPLIGQFKTTICVDSYHPETVFELVKYWKDNRVTCPLFWNDVSGKLDGAVRDFLKEGERFQYIYCHNRAPSRELTGRHMDYVSADEDHLLEELTDFFSPFKHERIIFDPCLGFSKRYDENWFILDHFLKVQKSVGHHRWLLGFSRKSFLREKFKFTLEDKEQLDLCHIEVLKKVLTNISDEVWIRTHRPELISPDRDEMFTLSF